MKNINNINDDYTNMFINEEEDLLEAKNFYLEASDTSILCRYNKWNPNPKESQVKFFSSYKMAKKFITKNHLGIVDIKDRDFTKKTFNDNEASDELRDGSGPHGKGNGPGDGHKDGSGLKEESETINPVRFEKLIYNEFNKWIQMIESKFGQGSGRTLRVVKKVIRFLGNKQENQTEPIKPVAVRPEPIEEAFAPNQNDGDVKVTMVFKAGKMVNWNFDGKPKTKDMLGITKLAPFIKKNLSYNIMMNRKNNQKIKKKALNKVLNKVIRINKFKKVQNKS